MKYSRRNCAASRFLSVGLVGLLLTACASQRPQAPAISSFPALQTSTGEVSVPTALASASTPDLLGLSAQMRDFADRYVNFGSQRQRLLTLHSSLLSPGLVDIRYDPAADGTAAEAFARSTANCLSYAHLFVAMARYVGLDARYLDVSLRPEWARHGDRVALQQHINVVVKLRSGEDRKSVV